MALLLHIVVVHVIATANVAAAIADESNFMVIFDAGSTGTRCHLFQYTPRICYIDSLPARAEAPLEWPEDIWSKLLRPGISSFAKNPDGVVSTLAPLLAKVKRKIWQVSPSARLSDVPVYLGATAGMRLLDDYERDTIMREIRSFFSKSGFKYDTQQIRILSGEEEGTFGWLSANYQMGTLPRRDAKLNQGGIASYGALDLGGGSAQITFVPFQTSILEHMFAMHFGVFAEKAIHVYSHSFLHFGYQSAFQQSSDQLALFAYNSRSFEHPCLPRGLVWNVTKGQYGVSVHGGKIERKNGAVQVRGSGDFAACRFLARSLIGKTSPCLTTPCSFSGVYQPRINETKFVMTGEYPQNFRRLRMVYDASAHEPPLIEMERNLRKWCRQSLHEQAAVHQEAIDTPVAKVELSCWLGVYILELLTTGLEFPMYTRNLIWGQDFSWPQGDALNLINYKPCTVVQRQTGLLAEGLVAAQARLAPQTIPCIDALLVGSVGIICFCLGRITTSLTSQRSSAVNERQRSLLGGSDACGQF